MVLIKNQSLWINCKKTIHRVDLKCEIKYQFTLDCGHPTRYLFLHITLFLSSYLLLFTWDALNKPTKLYLFSLSHLIIRTACYKRWSCYWLGRVEQSKKFGVIKQFATNWKQTVDRISMGGAGVWVEAFVSVDAGLLHNTQELFFGD